MKFLSLALFLLGLILLANAALPIIGYEIWSRQRFETKTQLLSPVPGKVARPRISDLTRASNWFWEENQPKDTAAGIRYYTLSIPKLKIAGSTVEIGGEDLAKNLIHYAGTAAPGRGGNTVIFGHSTLPQFFDPQNYLTIFSTLPKLKMGDEITLDYDGITYKYKITEMFEVSPAEVEVLRPYGDGSRLTLITCVPPGTYLRRLVIRADLVPPEI